MTPEETLAYLIDQGKITQEDVEELTCSPANQSFRTLVEGLHAVLCNLDHDAGDCTFHNETIQDQTWERECHVLWAEYAKELVEYSGQSPETLVDELRSVTSITSNLLNLSTGGKRILKDLIDCTPALSADRTLYKVLPHQPEETS